MTAVAVVARACTEVFGVGDDGGRRRRMRGRGRKKIGVIGFQMEQG